MASILPLSEPSNGKVIWHLQDNDCVKQSVSLHSTYQTIHWEGPMQHGPDLWDIVEGVEVCPN